MRTSKHGHGCQKEQGSSDKRQSFSHKRPNVSPRQRRVLFNRQQSKERGAGTFEHCHPWPRFRRAAPHAPSAVTHTHTVICRHPHTQSHLASHSISKRVPLDNQTRGIQLNHLPGLSSESSSPSQAHSHPANSATCSSHGCRERGAVCAVCAVCGVCGVCGVRLHTARHSSESSSWRHSTDSSSLKEYGVKEYGVRRSCIHGGALACML